MGSNKNNQVESNNSSEVGSGRKQKGSGGWEMSAFIRGCTVWLSLLAITSLAGSVALAQTQVPTPVTEIIALIDKHDQAVNQKDMDTVMALYAPGDTTVLMGTGPGEKWVGKDEISDAYKHFFQDFDKGSHTRDCFWKTGDSKGDVAWVSAICRMSDSMKGRKREYGLNVSAVLEQRDGTWLIRSMHFSNLTGGGAQSVATGPKRK